MRIVVQRVARAQVSVGGELVSKIGRGLLVLVGVQAGDGEQDARLAAQKIANLRIFEDENGKMNKQPVSSSFVCPPLSAVVYKRIKNI